MPTSLLLAQSLRLSIARAVIEGRHAHGWSRRELARRARLSRQLVDSVERGAIMPSLDTVARPFDPLGIDAELVTHAPFLIEGERQRDAAHARCGAYIQRRLQKGGIAVWREVEIVHGRTHGWIDLLAFQPTTRMVIVIEVKTQVDDLGRIERTLGWYEREAWALSRRLGWRPTRVAVWLMVLATETVEDRLEGNRDALGLAFPGRAPAMYRWLQDPVALQLPTRALRAGRSE